MPDKIPYLKREKGTRDLFEEKMPIAIPHPGLPRQDGESNILEAGTPIVTAVLSKTEETEHEISTPKTSKSNKYRPFNGALKKLKDSLAKGKEKIFKHKQPQSRVK